MKFLQELLGITEKKSLVEMDDATDNDQQKPGQQQKPENPQIKALKQKIADLQKKLETTDDFATKSALKVAQQQLLKLQQQEEGLNEAADEKEWAIWTEPGQLKTIVYYGSGQKGKEKAKKDFDLKREKAHERGSDPTQIKMREVSRAKDLKEMKNHMGETEFTSFSSWKSACKKADEKVWFDGDADICNAMTGPKPYKRGETLSIGEWDGAAGSVFGDKHLKPKAEVKEGADPLAAKLGPKIEDKLSAAEMKKLEMNAKEVDSYLQDCFKKK